MKKLAVQVDNLEKEPSQKRKQQTKIQQSRCGTDRAAELVGAHLMNSELYEKHTKYKSREQSHSDGVHGHLSQIRAYVEGGIKQALLFLQGIITKG